MGVWLFIHAGIKVKPCSFEGKHSQAEQIQTHLLNV